MTGASRILPADPTGAHHGSEIMVQLGFIEMKLFFSLFSTFLLIRDKHL